MSMYASVLATRHTRWSALLADAIAEGIDRQMVWGTRLMGCRLRVAPHVVAAVHSHEQVTLITRGRGHSLVDIFTPVREDFLPADAGGRA